MLPELQRSPLEELCMVARIMDPNLTQSVAEFLGKALEPPVPQAITAGITLLQEIGAMDAEERLTTLGRHLERLPLPPAIGKLLLYGLLFRCLSPIITVACALGYRYASALVPCYFQAVACSSVMQCRMCRCEIIARDDTLSRIIVSVVNVS
jgi:HrpA-like RNA helicase